MTNGPYFRFVDDVKIKKYTHSRNHHKQIGLSEDAQPHKLHEK